MSPSRTSPSAQSKKQPRKPHPPLKKKKTLKSRLRAPSGGKLGLSSYINTLTNPWAYPPVRLGWGSFAPTALRTAYKKLSFTPGATDTAVSVVCNPCFYVAATATGNSGFLSTYSALNSSTVLSGAGITQYGANNHAFLSTCIQNSRVISAALRVTVRYAATALRGVLSGLFLPTESMANLVTLTPAYLGSLNATRWATSDAAGEIGLEVQYRPIDPVSFDFDPATGLGTTALPTPILCAVISSFAAASFSVDVEVIVHYEALGGLDAAADETGGPSLAVSGITMDAAGQAASMHQPVVPSISAIESLDHALNNVSNSLQRTGMGSMGTFGRSSVLHGITGTVRQPDHGQYVQVDRPRQECAASSSTTPQSRFF